MKKLSVMGLFCEDIREEKSGIFTLVGILPDTVNVNRQAISSASTGAFGNVPRLLLKLCIYLRINFDPNAFTGVPQAYLVVPDSPTIDLGGVDAPLVEKAKTEAIQKGNELAGIILRSEFIGFQPPTNDSIQLRVAIEGEEYLAAAVRFVSE